MHLKELKNDSAFTLIFQTSSEARALQWMNASQTAGGKHPFLFSQCQASNARSVFPCQDSPSVRFTYSAEVEVPTELIAVMPARSAVVIEKSPAARNAACGRWHCARRASQSSP